MPTVDPLPVAQPAPALVAADEVVDVQAPAAAVIEAPVVEVAAVALPATVAAASPATVAVPAAATLPAAVPAGDGSTQTDFPVWGIAMIVAAALGAAAAGSRLLKAEG